MELLYENQDARSFLVCALGEKDVIDSMSMGMLSNNAIDGIAHAFYTQMNEDRYIKYDVTAKVTATLFFAGSVSKKKLLSVFEGIVNALLSADDYMIEKKSLLIDLDYIFVDVSTYETEMICIPVVSEEMTEPDLRSFFKNIIFTTQSDPTENCDHVARIINYLNSAPAFSLLKFKELINNLINEKKQQSRPASQPIPQPLVQQEQSAPADVPEQNVVVPAHKASSQPAKAEPMSAAEKNEQPAADEEKTGMTAWYLLRHYTKENAELYKAQKNAKPVKSKSESKKKAASGGQMPSFAIPGQEAPVSSSISTPTPQPVATRTAPQPVAPKTTSQSQVSQNSTPQPTPQHPSRQVQVAPQPPVPPPQPFSGVPQMGQQPIQTYVREEVTYAPGGNFGETTMLTARNAGETTMLVHNPAQRVEPYLLRLRTKERIALTKELFRIGKEPSYADYVVSDNPAVSRSHAYIILRDGGHYIVDTNSKNHTYLNGMMLRSNTEMLLSDNDKLRLADEEFEFHTR